MGIINKLDKENKAILTQNVENEKKNDKLLKEKENYY